MELNPKAQLPLCNDNYFCVQVFSDVMIMLKNLYKEVLAFSLDNGSNRETETGWPLLYSGQY